MVFACTTAGHLYNSSGDGQWSAPLVYDATPGSACYDIWGTAPDNLYLATSNGILHGSLDVDR